MSNVATDTEKTTCDACGMRRICRHDPKERWSWYCVMQCYGLSESERNKVRQARWAAQESRPPKDPPFAYPVIGGPLHDTYATTTDFQGPPTTWKNGQTVVLGPAGKHHHLKNEYFEFNAASRSRKRVGAHPSMIFVHKSLVKPLISSKDR